MKYDFEVGNFSIAARNVVESFLSMNEQNRDYIMFLMWLGFKDTTIELPGDERFAGKSTYTFNVLFSSKICYYQCTLGSKQFSMIDYTLID